MASTPVENAISGAAAGFAATAPMTALMEFGHERLPLLERYPLPPRIITEAVSRAAGADHQLNEPQEHALTLAAHFAYGAAAGALYGVLAPKVPGPPVAKGVAFGLAVWAGSYLGHLPLLRLHPPATEEPEGRNAVMIAAHVVWGAAMGLMTEVMKGDGGRHA